ncbi:MAG: ABC transporter permease [Deltaproteobacteria bacterium]|nr:ABC transporter permease [Deltaproteobacteria bacterium]
MINILFRLILSQFKIFFREPGVVFWSFVFPLLIAWILGIAFANKSNAWHMVAVVDESQDVIDSLPEWLLEKTGVDSAMYISDLELEWQVGKNESEQARFRFKYMNEDEAAMALKRGKISLWLTGNPKVGIRYHFDPDNTVSILTFLHLERAFSLQNSSEPQSEIRTITMKGSRYIDFLIPGLMAMSIMNACLWGIGWNLIDLRIKKLLRRMVATPLRKSIFLLSHGVNRMILSAFELTLLYSFAYYYFGIMIQGSLWALLLIFLSGYIAFAGIAVLISCRAQNTQSGNGLINLVSLPMFVLSGVFFSYQNFPDWITPYVEVLPLTMLANGLREVITESVVLYDVIIPSISLVGIGSICFALGLKFFYWH